MKRVRGVEEIGPPTASQSQRPQPQQPQQQQQQQHQQQQPHQQQQLSQQLQLQHHNVSVTSSSGAAVAVAGGGPTAAVGVGPGSQIGQTIDYLPGPSTSSAGINVQATGRQLQAKEMPGSIQYSQSQQQYPGAIVVPNSATAPIKGYVLQSSNSNSGFPANSSCAASIPAGLVVHNATNFGKHAQATTRPVGQSKMVQGNPPTIQTQGHVNQNSAQQFQRLKVEDALSYLDQVKYKFSDQPQVYNDFLDIMKEFKSQSIDTPGVITRVSHLFKGHPELIVGFNTFLPPGYKIEVQANEQGYAFQVSVSMPSPTATHTNTTSAHQCTVNVGSPPITSPPIQLPKAQPVVQIMQGGATIHPQINNIGPNSLPMHGSASPVPAYNNHVTQAQAQAVSQALSQAQDGVPVSGQQQQNQPVEFNHAINYVNKIKNRFQSHPDKYKRFLEILHTYQKEQRNMKESGSGSGGSAAGSGKQLTEAEVYSQVAKLFENQEDLLLEFGQFLPDATNQQNALVSNPENMQTDQFLSAVFQNNKVCNVNDHATIAKKPPTLKQQYNNAGPVPREQGSVIPFDVRDQREREKERTGMREVNVPSQKYGHSQNQLKRSPSFNTTVTTSNSHLPHGPPPPKKHKVASVRDLSIAEVGKHGTLADYAFFDKVRKALRSQEVYENFLRCLALFNNEIISKTELVTLVTPFLGRFPDLLRWFKEFLGYIDASTSLSPSNSNSNSVCNIEAVPNNVVRSHQDRPQGDLAMEIDYTACKRLGASYCAIPKTYILPKCAGRTALCKSVLNDTWVSFPTWSEDSTFVTSRKTSFEEMIYRCEDERFELDVVIETNAATIRVLEAITKKMARMTQEELLRFKLDDCLGGNSPTIHQRAIRRIYGDKAADIIDGLKKNPVVAVPICLRRLKAKEEEWREAQKSFNALWREQNEKFYLKSLDHQGINFKQTDIKSLRSKALYNEIELVYDERHENEENTGVSGDEAHLTLQYPPLTPILNDVSNLIIHHVKRQTSIQKGDKKQIKAILKQFVPDLFYHPRQELSDDEQDEENDKDDVPSSSTGKNTPNLDVGSYNAAGLQGSNKNNDSKSPETPSKHDEDNMKRMIQNHHTMREPNEAYVFFMGSNNWYLFMRLHQILCDRINKMYNRAMVLAEEERQYKQQRKESTAIALRLKPKNVHKIEEYYPVFLDMIKNLLDGNLDANQYEDNLREMFGIHAFTAFTLDKVVIYAVRQLQHIVCDKPSVQCMEIFSRERKRPKEVSSTGGLCRTAYLRTAYEMAYFRDVERLMTDENIFRIVIYKNCLKMLMTMIDVESEDNTHSNTNRGDRDKETSVIVAEKWSSYVENYSGTAKGKSTTSLITTTISGGVGVPGQSSKDVTSSTDSNAAASHPVSSDQASKGGRGRKRKNTDVNKKVDGNGWNSGHSNAVSGSSGSETLSTFLKGRKPVFIPRNLTRFKRFHPHYNEHNKTKKLLNVETNKEADTEASRSDIVTSEETQCTFNIDNYRLMYVVNQETIVYSKGCLFKARQDHPKVTKSKGSKFQRWHSNWLAKNTTDQQLRHCQEWLLGAFENSLPHRTRLFTDNSVDHTPYRPYNRYRVDFLVSPAELKLQGSKSST
ncbi:paired amphipathic helix protein Sin3a-like isoform X2 [Trichogramma pretiosum]|uniref:paired amphipathic helix protein Sin3a-like isoform X2 n=1 Tax=Trichogramma pretiosum TaxID=7493 RepID=UPI0006C9A1A6|nr:paired amphipathic helix protein Sin3a-like isoform X2 [Trichogramma pretiosum]